MLLPWVGTYAAAGGSSQGAVQGRVPTKLPGSTAWGSLSVWESESCWARGLYKLSLLLPPGRPACIFLFLRSNYFQQNWNSHPCGLKTSSRSNSASLGKGGTVRSKSQPSGAPVTVRTSGPERAPSSRAWPSHEAACFPADDPGSV